MHWQSVYCIFNHVEISQHDLWLGESVNVGKVGFNIFSEFCIVAGGVWGIDCKDCEFCFSTLVNSYQKSSTRYYFMVQYVFCVNISFV